MTPEQSRTLEIIVNLILKFIFGVGSLVGWFIVLFRWLDAQNQFEVYKYGAMQTFISITIGLVFRHYFGKMRSK